MLWVQVLPLLLSGVRSLIGKASNWLLERYRFKSDRNPPHQFEIWDLRFEIYSTGESFKRGHSIWDLRFEIWDLLYRWIFYAGSFDFKFEIWDFRFTPEVNLLRGVIRFEIWDLRFEIYSTGESFTRGHSSIGRALALHARGQEFDSPWLHLGCLNSKRSRR